MRWPRAVPLGSILLLCVGLQMSRDALARETWSEVEHLQILEGPDNIWVFVEVVRITDYTDEVLMHLMSKHPEKEPRLSNGLHHRPRRKRDRDGDHQGHGADAPSEPVSHLPARGRILPVRVRVRRAPRLSLSMA